ncbi:MAG: hypothetical protein WD151_04760 [Phycisphaeraceae bacterium]
MQKPSWAWLRYVELANLDDERAVLRVVPGHREVFAFITDVRLTQIGKVIEDVVGRRVRVTIDRGPTGAPDTGDAASGQPGQPAGGDRREAMGLPLVRQVLEIFPEASLIDIRETKPAPPTDQKP